MAIEYLSTERVMQIMDCNQRQARKLMREVGLVKVGHGLIRRDALDRYLALRTQDTFYTHQLLEQPIKPKYDRYARTSPVQKGAKRNAAV